MKIIDFKVYQGVNIYSHYPVIRITLDFGYLVQFPTTEFGSFNKRLLELVPTLQEHYCSRGKPGGFVERLNEGTYMGHILEHLILELQQMAGMEVIYGKTISTNEETVYQVIFEYISKEGGLQAAYSAINIIECLLSNNRVNIKEEVRKIKEKALQKGLGSSTQAIYDAALERGIPVSRIGEGSLLQLGYGKYQKKIQATITGLTSCIGVDIVSDKAFTKEFLSKAGIPVPKGGTASTEAEVLEIFHDIGRPVVIKPVDGNQGKGVALNLKEEPELLRAYSVAQNYGDKVIVEEFLSGRHYRITVVGNRVVAAAERIPAHIEGDGIHRINELINIANLDPRRGEGHEKALSKIKIDPLLLMVLTKKGLSMESIPKKGETVFIRESANLSTGGIAIDVTDLVHPENLEIALRAARLVGLDVAGIDIVTEDISRPISEGSGAIIEINAAPGIRMHHYPSAGKARDVAGAIVEMLYPQGNPARIPIISVTGTNGKTTTTRMIGHILGLMGLSVGMTTTDGIYIKNKLTVKGDTTGPISAKAVLGDPAVDVAVLETARGGILRDGLGYDRSDIGIVTNISSDHLGQGGIDSLDDMAKVKALVVEAVARNGHAVLNADDKFTVEMQKRIKAPVIYFSCVSDNVIIKRHLGAGGKAVFVKKGYLVIACGCEVKKVISIKNIPATMKGLAVHNIQNSLAAVAGCYGLGIEFDIIKEGLLSFNCNLKINPGRLNLLEIEGIKLLIDYGHNAAGYDSIIKFIQKIKPKRAIGIIGVPGNRQDKHIIDVGTIAGQGFKQIIIKEDENLKGRKPGEVADLLMQGVLKGGLKEEKVEIIHDEGKALKQAVLNADIGDLVVVFYENLNKILEVVKETREIIKGREIYRKETLENLEEQTIS